MSKAPGKQVVYLACRLLFNRVYNHLLDFHNLLRFLCPAPRVVQGGSLARFTNRKNSESRITAIKISFSRITKINK